MYCGFWGDATVSICWLHRTAVNKCYRVNVKQVVVVKDHLIQATLTDKYRFKHINKLQPRAEILSENEMLHSKSSSSVLLNNAI